MHVPCGMLGGDEGYRRTAATESELCLYVYSHSRFMDTSIDSFCVAGKRACNPSSGPIRVKSLQAFYEAQARDMFRSERCCDHVLTVTESGTISRTCYRGVSAMSQCRLPWYGSEGAGSQAVNVPSLGVGRWNRADGKRQVAANIK